MNYTLCICFYPAEGKPEFTEETQPPSGHVDMVIETALLCEKATGSLPLPGSTITAQEGTGDIPDLSYRVHSYDYQMKNKEKLIVTMRAYEVTELMFVYLT